MKFVTAEDAKGIFVGLMNESLDSVLPLRRTEEKWLGDSIIPHTMLDCIAMGEKFAKKVSDLLEWLQVNPENEELYISMKDLTLLAPIPRPLKNVFCVGKNYAEHAIEMGSKDDIPENVMIFTKAPTTVIGPNEEVLHHQNVTDQLDYEGELAVVIGKKGKEIKREEALDYVFGYTIINDVTARDLQSRHKQFFLGKSLDTTCPMGPWIVHSSAIENPHGLNIETRINNEIRQQSNTENLIFPIDEIISVLSQGMTLEPGDIIATGTPAGVGKGFKPPRFLNPGDKMEISIDGIGTLVNQIQE